MTPGSDDVDDLWFRRFWSPAGGGPAATAPTLPVKLLCFPHAGGSAVSYAPLARQLSPSLDVLAVQYPGRLDRRAEPPVEVADELADRILGALRPALTGPFAFFGHSMGAVVAFEVARRIQREAGAAPCFLFASGRRAPSVFRAESVHARDDAGLLQEIRDLSGTASSLLDDEDIVAMILPSLRSDYRLIERYRYQPGPALTCPITVLIGDSDPRVSLEDSSAWQAHTDGAFDLRQFPGGHFYLTGSEKAVASAVLESLSQTAW